MKKKKNALCIVCLVFVLTVLALASCGGEDEESAGGDVCMLIRETQ